MASGKGYNSHCHTKGHMNFWLQPVSPGTGVMQIMLRKLRQLTRFSLSLILGDCIDVNFLLYRLLNLGVEIADRSEILRLLIRVRFYKAGQVSNLVYGVGD